MSTRLSTWKMISVACAALALLRCAGEASKENVPTLPAPAPKEDAAPAPGPTDAASASEDAAPLLPAKRTLFVGNSFLYFNDLPTTYRGLAAPTEPLREAPLIDGAMYGGWTLTAHLSDARGTGSNPKLATLLGSVDAAAPTPWDWVVLQEQSQIPSFDPAAPSRQQSIASAVSLSEYATASGATTVLFMTWGYANGNYVTMQAGLEAGYRDMAQAIATAGRKVKIAPVGLAFKTVYEREVSLGHDPLAASSPFMQLYGPDAIHPAVAGTYLGACVVTATLHDADPTTFTADAPGIDATLKLVLQTAARDVVVAEKARPPL